jgi:hypothetical protein
MFRNLVAHYQGVYSLLFCNTLLYTVGINVLPDDVPVRSETRRSLVFLYITL